MIVAMLGGAIFQPTPVSVDAWERSGRYQHAVHDVVGAAPIYEAMGEAETEFVIRGTFFPEVPEMTLGLSIIAYLEQMRRAGTPVHYMRGDGVLFGWVLIREVRQTHDLVGPSGFGREIGFQATLLRCDAPSVGSILDIIGGLL